MINILFYFLLWTFILYWIHRAAHIVPFLKRYHKDHHIVIKNTKTKWHINNLLMYNDTKNSTIHLWLTEVIPSFIISYITGQWWIIIFYYVWAAFLQENLEHNKELNLPILTAGKWHLKHHQNNKKNFGLFISLWDKLFKTELRTE